MTDNALAVIVLAAGQGTRMKSKLPKVLHRIGGRPLIGHVLDIARDLGPAQVLVVVRHERDQVADAVAGIGPDVHIVDQDDVPGTGRAVQVALDGLPGFTGDVLVLSADVPLIEAETLARLVEVHRASHAAATLLTAVLDDATGYGRVIRDSTGAVARIVEQKDASEAEAAVTEINAGVYVFRADALRAQIARVGVDNAQGEMYLTDVIGLLRADDAPVAALTAPDAATALGVNDRVQLSEAARLLNARVVRRWQLEGATILDPATTWIDVTASLAPDVTVLPGSHILRTTTVASGAVVGPDTSLVDCEVGEDATVTRSDATLAVIGAGATVGPFAYLRPGTYLGDRGKIGTFVETKNSTIGEGSKVPHLSYIGDTTIGTGVNLGAGAITANYDDIAKHRTEIGDEVHTGSHNVFVAPVRIGDGAKTGAGAVIRKDVPAGALALSVAPQRNVEGWVETNRPGTKAADLAARARSAQKADDGSQEQDG
ncbi:bifunctional UDP-N-acetylglucosamine diphosphorylase/glucosamine-1-phosphate N-acetyltransferase GlmU [Microbacterium sp. zg.Y1090]|uniref:bifunctional UDP-N-acetylglucosamine diphosphorylase/glucosamine-1-phosphate N-acetyltransferase GlmU n=1 Tax=Microbacterium TaxID=33882 RepID=UPI00214CF166|nr:MULTISPECIES: bifunctional UDP-N-acetylglucosamine diphosphorylase/glucosamine-1-phosphate N-acetyltransferase GlmU [unclassified Microbacterium]MCR2812210.1 bifunctional UDP-N-acetylglucosamine diphosphorylase/glucosamine-1-phosphate N-acetyltransferase GlmU [Microbacterium sp. zg.Y1084]MCR2818352.1 bifunctional UDP-N-acetylglucosamine diphosphorylase/glucosamine-1-phosphate N-acetyltransferase GlmU [Microbacterium sp. zg.Y1090]WIM29371.1 bifunctional UDP-N-acetylglucosamine diphosphorylase/